MNNEIILTITMLVSNREDTIEKCLKSISHLMKVVPSELIIVDTAGNEFCMSIVREYTDKIVSFKWCDDFAAARNAGLRNAQGKWVMFLDDDEWFEDTKELEEFFLSGLYKKYKTATYLVRNYLNHAGTEWKDSFAMRLAMRVKTTQFVGKIHESLSPLDQPVYHTKDFAHHYGYVFDTEQERIEHSWRNIQPLLARRKEKPDDYHAAAQLVQEYMGTRDYFAALELIRELRKKPQAWTGKKIAFTSYVVVKEIEIYRIQQRFKDAYKTGKELLNNDKNLLFVKGALLNQLIGICYKLEKYSEALFFIEQYKDAMKEWKKNPGYEKQDIFRVSQQYMIEAELNRFMFMELRIYSLEEQWAKAGETISNIDWTYGEMRMLVNTAEDIVKTLSQLPYSERYIKALEFIINNPVQKEAIFKFIDEMENEQRWKVLSYLYDLDVNDKNIYKYQIIYAGYKEEREKIYFLLNKMKQNSISLLLEDIQYWKVLYEYKISLASYIANIRSYEWIQIAPKLLNQFELEDREIIYVVLSNELNKKDIKFLYLTALWMEKQLLENQEADNNDEWKRLYNVALHWISCAMFLYKEEVFTSDLIEAIPPQYQFAWYIVQANALKDNNNYLFIQKVAEAAKSYSIMKELCKKIIIEYSDVNNDKLDIIKGLEDLEVK